MDDRTVPEVIEGLRALLGAIDDDRIEATDAQRAYLHNLAGLRIEQAALLWLAGLCGFYGVIFLAHAGRAELGHVLYVVPLVLAFAAVNLVRARQITREIDQARQGLRRLGDVLNRPEAAP